MTQERQEGQPERIPSDGLTLEQDIALEGLLKLWEGGRLSAEVFTEIARLIPQPIIEVVVLRNNCGIIETLLLPRPKDEKVKQWEDKYHTPGSALRNSDVKKETNNDLSGPFERVERGELGTKFAYPPKFGWFTVRKGDRSVEMVQAYYTELEKGADIKPGHIWYPVDMLAGNELFLQHQLEHVVMTAEAFRESVLEREMRNQKELFLQ